MNDLLSCLIWCIFVIVVLSVGTAFGVWLFEVTLHFLTGVNIVW